MRVEPTKAEEDNSPPIIARALPGGRFALLAVVIALHGLLFWILSGLTIFPAPPQVVETASFQAIAVPARPFPPPPPPTPIVSGGGSAGMPTLPAAPVPAPAIPTVAVNFAFTVPKVTMPFDNNGKVPAIQPAGGAQGPTGSGTGQGDGTGLGNDPSVTSDTAVFAGAVHDGVVLGLAPYLKSMIPHAKEIDDFRNRPEVANIRWDNFQTKYASTQKFKPTYDPDVDHVIAWTLGALVSDVNDIYRNATTDANGQRHTQSVDCVVLLFNFNTPLRSDDFDMRHAIACLRDNHIRLCVVAFDHAPYGPILDYVRESGGKVLFPTGIPGATTARQLSKAIGP